MTPAAAIDLLDRQLAEHGEDVTLHSATAGVPDAGASARAFVRGYKPDELIGDIRQNDRKVIVSPTTVPIPPTRGGKVRIAGKSFNIEAVNPFRMANVLVRIEMQVRG